LVSDRKKGIFIGNILVTKIILSFLFHNQHQPFVKNSMNIKIRKIDYSTTLLDCDSCKSLPKKAPMVVIERQYRPSLPQLNGFCINPLNPQEIVYSEMIEDFHIGFTDNIYYFNLKNRQRRLLTTGLLSGQPRWHRNGWILLPFRYRIAKIKANGEHLTELTSYESNAGAVWNPKGNQFAFYHETPNRTLHIADANNGKRLETISALPKYDNWLDWSKPHGFVQQNQNGNIIGYNPQTQQQELFVLNQGYCAGFCWLDDARTMVFANYAGLFVTNTVTKQVKKIQCGCQTVQYSHPEYVPQHRKIYALKAVSMVTDPPKNNHVLTTTFLVKMNLDGSDEQIIDLPQ
jgi:hypothetical protein